MSDLSGDPFTPQAPQAARPEEAAAESEPRVRLPVRRGGRGRLDDIAQSPHTAEGAFRWSLVVAGGLVVAYWFTQWPLPRLLQSHPDFNFYLVQPVIWLAVAGLAFYGWLRLGDRPRFSRVLVGIAFLVGVFHVAVTVIAGVVWDFGDSPIAGKLLNYPKNFWFITTLLAGAEVSRAYLFQVWKRRNPALAFAGVSALLFAVGVAAAQWTPFDSIDTTFRIVGGRWLPAIALSLLCTWLVSYGGLGPSFAYRWALVAFEWFSPILPNLDWPVLLGIGVGVPLAAEWLVRSIYEDTAEGTILAAGRKEKEKAPGRAWVRWTGWGVTAILIALLVLFAVGAFGYHLSVVDGPSMEPAFGRGDILIVKEGVDPASLRVQDVIQFRLGSLPVVHRIIGINEGESGLLFTTQGDNMDTPDPVITADQIDGKVVFSVPGVGYLNLWLRGR